MSNVTALKQTARRRAPRQLRAHLEICSVCGCTDRYACDGGCYWAASASSLRFLKRMVRSA